MIVETNTMTATQLIKPLSVETKEGLLFVGGCSVDALIKEHGSPLYVMDIQSLNQTYPQYELYMSHEKVPCPCHQTYPYL